MFKKATPGTTYVYMRERKNKDYFTTVIMIKPVHTAVYIYSNTMLNET